MEGAGIEAVVADPGRPGTVLDLVGDVTLVVWLLGSAEGEPESVASIHGPRLEALLARLVDTPVRGFAYEAAGSVAPEHLERGAGIVERAGTTWSIPVAILREVPPAGSDGWAGWSEIAAGRLLELLR